MKTDERREERVAMQDLTKGMEDWGEKPEDLVREMQEAMSGLLALWQEAG